MDRNLLLVFAIFIIAIVIIGGMIYFYVKSRETMEKEEFGEFLFTINDLQTFLIIIFVVIIPIIGFLIFRRR